MGVIS